MKRGLPFYIISIVSFAALLVAVVSVGTTRFYNNTNEKQLKVVQKAVERSAIQCFALEGAFPPDVDYLEKHYGLKLDKKRFIYDYSVFASNIKPEINIFLKYGQGGQGN